MSLDPRANRIERERKEAVKNAPPPLNPPFPFRAVQFDPGAFDLQQDPPAIDNETKEKA